MVFDFITMLNQHLISFSHSFKLIFKSSKIFICKSSEKKHIKSKSLETIKEDNYCILLPF